MKTQDTNFNPKMSLEGQLSDNELIAEFMGLPLTKKTRSFVGGTEMVVPFMNWKYDTSWDWLMPVVEKISQMDEVASIEFFVGVTIRIWTNDQMIESMGEGIEPVYKAVVEFIKWYKNQTP